jgi:hypothetical protein
MQEKFVMDTNAKKQVRLAATIVLLEDANEYRAP